jgi:hypothetical protein
MGSKIVVVAGNGETTRVNVEALLEDYYRGKGKDVVLVLPFNDRPSQGQVWAHQVSSELGIPTTVICPENSVVMSIGNSSVHNSANPIQEVVEMASGEDSVALLLWNDTDSFTASLAAAFKEASVPCYDLCVGLVEVSAGKPFVEPEKVVTEKIPQVETVLRTPDLEKAITQAVLKVLKDFGIAI